MTPRFAALFFRQSLRPAVRRPLLPILNVLSIAIGVTVFLAIQLANRSALSGFQNAVALVAGRAHLEVRGDLPETLFPKIAAADGVKSATPLVEGLVTLPDEPGEYLRILGVDPFSGEGLRVFELEAPDGGRLDLEAWLREPDSVALAGSREIRGPIRVQAGGRTVTLVPRFLWRTSDAAVESDPRLAPMDIAWAQELLDRVGRLTSIQVELEKPLEADAVAASLRELVPADATVFPPARRGAETEQMLAAFQLNLTALSLVSIVVGVFLIYNSLSAAVVRRRVEIGILRANGATRTEVAGLFLGEGLFAGLAGTLIGIALAQPLASILAAPVAQTVTSLYTVVSPASPELSAGQILLALTVGLGASLLAAWRPAAEAANCDPAAILHPGSVVETFRARPVPWLSGGLVAIGLSTVLSWLALTFGLSLLGFAAVGFLIAGFSLTVPWAVTTFAAFLRPSRSWLVRLAAQHLARSMHRNVVTIAALAVAAGMTVSVSVMIHSFRASVVSWTNRTLVADLFIAPAANEIIGLQAFMPRDTLTWAREQPGIVETATFRELPVRWNGRTVSLGIADGRARGELEFLRSLPDAKTLFHSPGYVVVSESFSTRHGTRPGDRLTLAAPGGPAEFRVAGVIRDFTRDSGLILMDRSNFARHWDDERVHSFAIRLRDSEQAAEVAERFREQFGREGAFSIYTNAALRGRVMEIFDQTFAVTSVLRVISVVVAIAGVFLALTTLVAEREREIGVLRSLGASRPQVRGLVLGEAAMIGVVASIVGVACGAGMAMILTWVINKAFFGWTIDLRYPLDVLATTPLWLVPAAVAAAWWPAARASRTAPAQAVRFE